ncbi:hypothetical protein M8A51_25880, partial [Schlegelella sp. S2-27]
HLNSGTKAHQRVYDLYGRLVRYPLGGAIRDLTYDAANRITAYTHWNASTGASEAGADQQFGYDELGRLTSVVTAQGSWSFSYDANGNRTQAVLNGSPSAYTVSNTSNRLEAVGTGRSFGHDAVGNTTTDSGLGYTATYSLENRLGQLTKTGTSYTYTHNADGQRVRKYNSAGAATTVLFVYDLDGQLLGEYDRNGNAIKEYVWMGNTPVAVFTPGATANDPPTVYYIHVDHLNTPRMVRNQADQRRWRWMLAEPFGSTAAENNPDGLGNFSFNLRFPGQYFDQETGLHYNWHRDYDSTIGRYIESDPIGLDGGINTYSYVSGNPLSYIDRSGEAATLTWCFGGPWGCAAGAGAAAWAIWMSTPSGQEAVRSTASSSAQEHCCAEYRHVYQPNDGKHGSSQRPGPRGHVSPEPANGAAVLATSVPAGLARIGHDPATGQLVVFRNHHTDEKNCIKYWHGYVVGHRDLTPDQWRAGRDAGYPNWPRKPQ